MHRKSLSNITVLIIKTPANNGLKRVMMVNIHGKFNLGNNIPPAPSIKVPFDTVGSNIYTN